jgi:hypothetical protein
MPLEVERLGVDHTVTVAFLALAAMTLTVAWLPYYLPWCVLLLVAGVVCATQAHGF